jgi:hypothetical protein
MRAIFVAIVVVAVGYLAWTFYQEAHHSPEPAAPIRSAISPPPIAPSAKFRGSVPTPLAIPTQLAPPGVYYTVERVSVQTSTGVKALNPGAEVRLMYRAKNGTMRVTDGKDEFVVKPSTLTKDRGQIPGSAPR